MNTHIEPDLHAPPADPAAEKERAREYLLRALTASPKTRQQLAQRLAERDVDPGIAEDVLDRFVEVGLIDDAEYAMSLARTRYAERGLSRRAIAYELRRKGIDEQHMEPALNQISQEDEESAARGLVRNRMRRVADLAPDVQYRRLASFLGRKGYGGGLAHRAISDETSRFNADRDEQASL